MIDVTRALLPATAGTSANAALAQPHRITNNQAAETHARWAPDSRHIFFTVEVGDVSGPYRDLQPHLYSVDTETGQIEQWAKSFIGPVENYAITPNVVADAFVRPASAASVPITAATSVRTNASGATLHLRTPRHRSPNVFRRQTIRLTPPPQQLARHLRRNLHRHPLPKTSLHLLLSRQARRNLPSRQRHQTRSSQAHHLLQQTLHRTRSPPRQAL